MIGLLCLHPCNFSISVKRLPAIALVAGVPWLFTSHLAAANPVPLSLAQQTNEVVAYLEGTMDTSLQAATNPKAPKVRMTTCRITLAGTSEFPDGTVFLYQEQALLTDLDRPYRQRFLQISPSLATQRVRSLSFKPRNLADLAGFCARPASSRTVQIHELGTPVCSVFLKPTPTGYIGNTPIDGCPANFRGAVRITNQILLGPDGMDTWDRGFDASGKQVWGAETESYQFRRRR